MESGAVADRHCRAAACIAVAGWLGTRSTLRQPPLAALREST